MEKSHYQATCVAAIIFISLPLLSTTYAKTIKNPPVGKHNNSANKLGVKSLPLALSYSSNGLTFATQDGLLTGNIHTYLQADYLKFSHNTSNLNSGTNLRRARMTLSGKLTQAWGYNFEYDFSNGGNVTNAHISYLGWKNNAIKVGQFLPQFTLADWASNLAISALELAPVINAFAPPYSMGVGYSVNSNSLAFNAAVFGPGSGQTVTGRNPIGSAVRLVYSPIHTATKVFETGISGRLQKPDGTDAVTFNAVPDATSRSGATLVSTGAMTDVKRYTSVGPEIAMVYGSWSAQSEYLSTDVDRRTNLRFSGYYVTASYFLTGESRLYGFPGAAFDGITPIQHSYGAWQLVMRFDHLNLNDKTVRGGKERDVTTGVNWFANQFVSFKLNYIRAMARRASDGKNKNVNIIAGRMQVQF